MAVRTADQRVFVGGANWLVELDEALGITIGSTATVTNEAYLGSRDEEASCHAVAYNIALATLYASVDTDALAARVGSPASVAVIGPGLWSMFPVDIPPMPETAPEVSPVTAEFSMGASGRGDWGVLRYPFELKAGSLTQEIDASTGNVLAVILTQAEGSGLKIGKSTNTADVANQAGISFPSVPAAGLAADTVITGAGLTGSKVTAGFVLIGNAVPLAADAA